MPSPVAASLPLPVQPPRQVGDLIWNDDCSQALSVKAYSSTSTETKCDDDCIKNGMYSSDWQALTRKGMGNKMRAKMMRNPGNEESNSCIPLHSGQRGYLYPEDLDTNTHLLVLDEAMLRRLLREELQEEFRGRDRVRKQPDRFRTGRRFPEVPAHATITPGEKSSSSANPSAKAVQMKQGDVADLTPTTSSQNVRNFSTFTDDSSKYWNLLPSTPLHATMQHYKVTRYIYEMFTNPIDYCFRLAEPRRQGFWARIVLSTAFELVSAMAIIANSIFSIIATNEEVSNNGENMPIVKKVEIAFLTFYTVEFAMRFSVHRMFLFWCSDTSWHVFDVTLVTFGILDQIFSGITNFIFMRSWRILKVVKILRILRLMRMISDLRLILNSIMGSLSSLTWSIVMMLMIFYMFGTVFTQSVARYIWEIRNGQAADELETDLLLDAFGSVQRAVLSLFMACTGGEDWRVHYDLLGATGGFSLFVYLFFIAFANIALLNILTGLFIESALKLAEPDHETRALALRKRQIKNIIELTGLCMEYIANGDGMIDEARFVQAMADSTQLRSYLETLGLEVFDVDLFYRMLKESSPDQDVAVDSFVQGCMRLKGSASSLDMQTLQYQTKADYRCLSRKLARVESKLDDLCSDA